MHTDPQALRQALAHRLNRTIKERMPYVHEPDGRIRPAAQSFVQSCVRATYGQEFADQLEPSLTMRYRGITLVGKYAPERVTIERGDPPGAATARGLARRARLARCSWA